jgi:CO/xanthine dehydrogenase FAD-binding subunit
VKACVNFCEARSPKSLKEALELLASEPGTWLPIAGATDVMVSFAAGKLPNDRFMNINQLEELRGIYEEEGAITLGALTTYSEVLSHRELCSTFPLLAEAAAETGGVATQNRGTLGGNIMNASPAADTPPALLVYEAEVELTSIEGPRWLSYCGFHTAYKQTMLMPGELLTRIRLPRINTPVSSHFRKVGTRKAQAISKVCFAGISDAGKRNVRIAYGSVAPVPLRCFRTEEAIRRGEDPSQSLAAELAPITDIRSTAEYRLRVARKLLLDFLHHA